MANYSKLSTDILVYTADLKNLINKTPVKITLVTLGSLFVTYQCVKFITSLKVFQQKIVPKMMRSALDLRNIPFVIEAKEDLFESLKEYDSPTILDVGAGGGYNLRYFPEGSKVIAVEPNENYHEDIRRRAETEGSHVVLDSIRCLTGENLKGIADESVDAYVTTHVTCLVDDMDSLLREARRVLKRGGRLYIFHHFFGPNKKIVTLQTIFDRCVSFPIIQGLILRCNYDKDIRPVVRQYFPNTDAKLRQLPFDQILFRCHLLSVSKKD